MNIFNLKGRTAIVTGGGSGIGLGIAWAYAEAGANVVLADLDGKTAEQAVQKLRAEGYEALAVRTDVTDIESFEKALELGEKTYGTIDILVNNAGITLSEDVFDISLASWRRIFEVNTEAVFFCSQAFAKRLKDKGKGGNIVIISSNAAKCTFNRQAHYNASKAAVANLAQSLSKEFSLYGINVNAVCPGGTDTEMLHACMLDAIDESGDPDLTVENLREMWGAPCLGRLIKPIEVGRVAVFLSTEAATIIRGQAITIDAGSTPY